MGKDRFSKITGIKTYIPRRKISNDELARLCELDTDNEWIKSRTGILYRHIAGEEETLAYMAEMAAKDAIKQANEKTQLPVDIILFATNTSVSDPLAQSGFPCMAGGVQNSIVSLIRSRCGICDVQSGCAGINYALAFGNSLIMAGYAERVLAIGGDILSRIVNFNDRNICVLVGDGVAAYVLDVCDLPGFIGNKFYGDGAKRGIITSPLTNRRDINEPKTKSSYSPTLSMDGRKVHEEVIDILTDTFTNFETDRYLNPLGHSLSNVVKIVPHQANCRTIEAAAKKIAKERSRLGLSVNDAGEIRSKFIVTIGEYANNSTASQGPGLEKILFGENHLNEGEHIVMCSYGSGFSACFNHYVV